MMSIQEIAGRLVELCRKGDFTTAHEELYAESAISIEPQATPGFDKETYGLPAIREKGRKFDKMVKEMHALYVTEPVLADNSFACVLTMDVTMEGQERMTSSELCVYLVKNGKIVSEQFFM